MTAAAWIGGLLLVGAFCGGLAVAATPAPSTSAAAPAPSAASEPPRVTLHWKTREQGMTYGYLVYRSERRAGPFVRRNDAIVRVPDDGVNVHEYVWVDEAVTAGVTYFYYVDAVSTGGVKERLSGVIEKRVSPATRAPEPTPSPPGGER